MRHLAIDLGGRESQICIRDASGEIVEERRWTTASLRRRLAAMEPSRVVLETCAEAFQVADWAREHGHDARVVPATLARTLGVGARGIKTDRRDAQVLSEVSCRIELPSVHLPSAEARRVKSVCGMREALVECRTKLVNSVRGWLRTQARRIRSGASKTFAQRVRETLEAPPEHVERQLSSIESLCAQIREADQEVEQLARKSELCQRLRSVPGVGPITSLRFVAAVDDIRRFQSAHALESYLGLTPGEHSSSQRKRRTSITKAGAPALRWTLIQAAWAARRSRRREVDPMVQWSLEVEKRRGKRTAIVALSRKLAGVMYAIWRDGSVYDPTRMLDDRSRHRQEVAAPITP